MTFKCVICLRTSTSRCYPYNNKWEAFVQVDVTSVSKVCNVCSKRLSPEHPSVHKSTIPGAGNGLFAERDYGFGEVVTYYDGEVYAKNFSAFLFWPRQKRQKKFLQLFRDIFGQIAQFTVVHGYEAWAMK